MESEKHPYVPEPAIGRLPWYLACVSKMRAEGVDYVSSTAISHQLNVDASQIAKDLSYLNIKGKTRIGYDVAQLEEELNDFLGFHRVHRAVMIGVGSLGRALITDSGLSRYGLDIVAGFDIDPDVTGTDIEGIPVYDMARLCVDSGIKALWNFTPFHIKATPDVTIQNTSIYAHLAVMYNRMKQH